MMANQTCVQNEEKMDRALAHKWRRVPQTTVQKDGVNSTLLECTRDGCEEIGYELV